MNKVHSRLESSQEIGPSLLNGFEMSHVLWNPFYSLSHTPVESKGRRPSPSRSRETNFLNLFFMIFESPVNLPTAQLRCDCGTCFSSYSIPNRCLDDSGILPPVLEPPVN